MNIPVRDEAEACANAAFEALMWALSRPGHIRTMPAAGDAAIVDALIDRECRVYASEPLLMAHIARAGAEIAPPERADHLFLGRVGDAGELAPVAIGSDLYPDDGATVIAQARIGGGSRLRLTGPGVDGSLDIAVGGLPEGFWRKRAAMMRYPIGFELFLVDGDRLIGIPRSTTVEVL